MRKGKDGGRKSQSHSASCAKLQSTIWKCKETTPCAVNNNDNNNNDDNNNNKKKKFTEQLHRNSGYNLGQRKGVMKPFNP